MDLYLVQVCDFILFTKHDDSKATIYAMYEGVSKSPKTMLITLKSLLVHEFPARVCCGDVL